MTATRRVFGHRALRPAGRRLLWLAALLPLFFSACSAPPTSYPEPSPSFYEVVTLPVTVEGETIDVAGSRVEPPFFQETGVSPYLGRLFVDEEFIGGDRPAALIGHELWQESFGGDPEIIGRTVRIGDIDRTVIGIMPPDFTAPGEASFWIAGAPGPVVFRDVRVFDGEAVLPSATVVLEDRRIGAVVPAGEAVDVPAGARIVDGAGKTLLPGLIDAHTHSLTREHLKGAVAFGVTTHLDMFTGLPHMEAMKAEQGRGSADDRADLYSAGTVVTAPGGHGTQYGMAIPTLSTREEADAFIAARIDEGIDYVKVIYEDGTAFGGSLPTLDEATLRAAIEAAHERGMLAVVHIGSLELARSAVAAGADGLVHTFAEQPPDDGFGTFVADHGTFVVPTLVVIEAVSGGQGGVALIEDPRLNPLLMPQAIDGLNATFPPRLTELQSLDHALASVRALHGAGVTLLAGSDAPNPGTYHGVSLHRELELLTRAGLTPLEALTAATSATAAAFGLNDRGRIAPGMRADVLLVAGDPTADILATRAIEGVWKEGRRWKHELLRAQVQALRADGRTAPQ